MNDIYDTLKDMFKDVLQEMLEAELDQFLGYSKYDEKNKEIKNSRNGYYPKTIKAKFGNIYMEILRDREGEFSLRIIPKHKRDITGIEEKIIGLYARDMSTRDIHKGINDIYGIEISAEMVSKITDKILPQIKEWQNRLLEPIYPFIFMDAIHYKVRDSGQIVNRAAYIIIGVNIEGYKDVLGIWAGANGFPSDAALEKILYLATQNITKKWTQRYRNWDGVLNQLIILYPERLKEYL